MKKKFRLMDNKGGHKDSFLSYLYKVRNRTVALVKVIPEDKIDWSYKAGKFSIGDILRHITLVERYMYAETMCNRKSLYTGHHKSIAPGLDDIMFLMHNLRQESLEIFSSFSENEYLEKCLTPTGAPISRWKWLRAMMEHEIHHRGQLYIYLNILDIETPPMFGLSAEELMGLGSRSKQDKN